MSHGFPVTRFTGRVLLFLSRCAAIVLSFALLALPFNRSSFQELSDGIYGSGTPLMGSMLFDFLLRPWISVFLGLVMLCFVYARFYRIPPAKRCVSDLVYLAVAVVLMMAVQFAFYLPITKAPAL